jgi:phosphinothricin acetyltransferase
MIRSAVATDGPALAAIYNHYIENTVVTFEEEAITGEEMARRILDVQAAGYPWLVRLEADRVVGYAYGKRWNARSAYRSSLEVSVYLEHSQTGKGWGSELYSALWPQLKALGTHVLIAGITLPNPGSVALHEKFGMHKVAHFQEVGFKLGEWRDVGYWQVIL